MALRPTAGRLTAGDDLLIPTSPQQRSLSRITPFNPENSYLVKRPLANTSPTSDGSTRNLPNLPSTLT